MDKKVLKFTAAAIIYVCFSLYLYQPHFEKFKPIEYLYIINTVFASLGCFVLSRRWISSFSGSFFAGAIYGFGVFVLGLARFHPTAGFLAASIGWLFCPAAYGPKNKWRWLRVPLCGLPFLAIILFFQAGYQLKLFAVPVGIKLHLKDLATLVLPLIMVKKGSYFIGFYHIPIAAFITGLVLLLNARRFGIVLLIAAGVIPAFCKSFLGVSPVMWLVVPALCCSVIVGTGIQGLALAGFSDKKWVLSDMLIMGTLAIATLLLTIKCEKIFAGLGEDYAVVSLWTAKMYILGAVMCGLIFFMAKIRLNVRWLRMGVLCTAMALDIFYGAEFVIDKSL
ncbi:MAG: hypothetical protein ACYSSI_01880 [Planctomycetota bacterium]|jgi:hypothetical protein